MKKLGMIFVGLVMAGSLFWSCSEDNSTTITQVDADNIAPSCVITSPAPSLTFEKGSDLTVDVDADDTDGNIFEVRYYMDGIQKGTDKDSPYSYSFDTPGIGTGDHIIKVTAVDTDGAKTSDSVEVVINVLPGCAITFPADKSYFTEGDDVSIAVSAADDEKDSKSVTRVDFYIDGAFISSDTESPYAADWTMGGHESIIKAVVTDDLGSVTSDEVHVLLNVPVTFADANLEQAVRTKIIKPAGTIYSSDVGYVTSLEAYSSNISDLSGMEYFISLDSLTAHDNQISDLTPLQDISGMKLIYIDRNNISDLTPLANLTELEALDLSYNNISDISALSNLVKLKYVTLASNQIGNISALRNLTDLEVISVADNNITDITPLEYLTGLVQIRANENNISDISSLKLLSELNYLNLNDNQIDDIFVMSNFNKLFSVYLNNNNIGDITAFRFLPKIRNIYLYNNDVSNIYPLVQNPDYAGLGLLELPLNPLDSLTVNVYIPELQSRGIMVSW